jgi:hypothetical protein
VTSTADRLRDQPGVESVVTYYDTKAENFVSHEVAPCPSEPLLR